MQRGKSENIYGRRWMNIYTVSFFGHRRIENALEIERRLEQLLQTLLRNKEYVEFLVGRDGENRMKKCI